MRLRCALVPALAAAAVAALAAPAFAHEEITPKTILTGQPAFLSLTSANEASSDMVKIVLKTPANLGLGEATRSPAGWSATAGGNTATWTGGALKPGTFETFGFEVEAPDQPGTLTFTVTSTFANGRTDEHEVEITAAAPGAGGASTPPTAATATSAATAPNVASTSPTTATAAVDGAGDSNGDSDGASGTARAALAVSIVALVLAAGALAMSARGRRASGPAGGGSTPGAPQDW